ncbi:MAG: twin-arginine translocase TatA/TatE family subunit [Oscillospiraceae bacterium]|nr:twin-arginine translocase TatA/TatE family subunit [Oscillospiraceae bacterium]
MKIGALELIVVFIVALLVIGPDKLPQYARKFGAAMREFRKASQDVTQEIRESVIDPLEEAQKPLKDAIEPIEELEKGLKDDVKSVEKDLRDLGKAK